MNQANLDAAALLKVQKILMPHKLRWHSACRNFITMKSIRIKISCAAAACALLVFPALLLAGASGTISGYVSDKETGKKLPGAAITVEGTNFGAMADRFGFYIIYNVPVGKHSVRASMIGYVPTKITNVEVKTDLNTPAHFDLQSRVLELGEEVVVTAPRVQILRDVLSSTHYLGQETINSSFPAQNFYDFLPLVPGYVNNHFRASRNTGVQYLIDGLPASEAWTRAMAFSLPVPAITEMVVQTGGFSAEYGNLTSGLVNLITQDGRNNLGLSFKVSSDFLGRHDEVYENTRRAEAAVGGPLTLGFGGPTLDANYFISGRAEFTDTPQGGNLRRSFNSPVQQNYDWNAKVMMRLSQNIFLRGQMLASRWNWRQYEPLWAGNVAAMPERFNNNKRASLALTHTLSARLYYQLEISRSDFQRRISGAIPPQAEDNYLVPGLEELGAQWRSEPWQEDLRERQWLGRAHLIRQFNPVHQLKLGVEGSYWDLAWARDRYLLWPGGEPAGPFVYSRYTDSFEENPFSIAGYGHHKIELQDFLMTFGLRYELFSPNRAATDWPARIQSPDPIVTPLPGSLFQDKPAPAARGPQFLANDSAAATPPKIFHHTLAPRLSFAIPIGNVEHLSINYGHFYELPPFYNIYVNAEGARSAYWTIYGNTALKPVQAKAWEATYRRAITEQTVFTLTGFWRKYANQIGIKRYPVTSALQQTHPADVFQYDNSVQTTAGGLEMSYRRQFSRALSGAATYTYLHGSGSASWPESKFLDHARGEPEINNNYQFPLAWDQRHTFTLYLNWQDGKGHLLSLFSQVYGPAKAEAWFTGEEVELGWRQFLSMKGAIPLHLGSLRLQPFLEARNVLNLKYAYPNQAGIDFSQPATPSEDNLGRRIVVGVSFN